MGDDRRPGGRIAARLSRHVCEDGSAPAARDEPQAPDQGSRGSRSGRGQGIQHRGADGRQLKLDVQAATGIADSGDPEQDLTELVGEIGEVARTTGAGALFLIDEMHNLDSASLAALCIAFQAVSRNSLPVAMVAAGLPDLQTRLMSAKPYADRLFQYHELGRPSPAAARAALIAPAATRGVSYEEAGALRVVEESAGYTYFIQEYGLELWNHAEISPITCARRG